MHTSNGGANRGMFTTSRPVIWGYLMPGLALEEGVLFHFAYFVSAMELADIMDFYKEL